MQTLDVSAKLTCNTYFNGKTNRWIKSPGYCSSTACRHTETRNASPSGGGKVSAKQAAVPARSEILASRFDEAFDFWLKLEYRVRSIRRLVLIVLLGKEVISRIAVSLAVALALFAATVRLPATACVMTNAPSPKACEPGCCANKTCCLTSHERTGPPVQPLTKASPDQQHIVAIAAHAGVVVPVETARKPQLFSSVEYGAHSPPTLALLCIRLI